MITFIRHSESQWNTREVKKNEDHISLSSKGIKMCKKIEGNYDLVVISDTKRTKMTFDHSKIRCENVKVSKYCKEIKRIGSQATILKFKKKLKKYSKIYKNILVISHRGYIKKMTGKNLKNLELVTVKYSELK